MVILLFGPPGCGKGTQSRLITNWLEIPSISTGEMLRAECEADTGIGREVAAILARGSLVADEKVNQILLRRVSQPDCRGGFLLDGYPRTLAQAGYLDDLLCQRAFAAPTLLHLDVPVSVLVARISARRQCPLCGRIYNLMHQPPADDGRCDADGAALIRRQDDREEVVRERLLAYEKSTGPVIQHYAQGDYHRIDGNRPPGEIFREFENLLRPSLARRRSANGADHTAGPTG